MLFSPCMLFFFMTEWRLLDPSFCRRRRESKKFVYTVSAVLVLGHGRSTLLHTSLVSKLAVLAPLAVESRNESCFAALAPRHGRKERQRKKKVRKQKVFVQPGSQRPLN